MTEYIDFLIGKAEQIDVQVWQQFDNLSPEELQDYAFKNSKTFLTYLANNEADALLFQSIERHLNQQLPADSDGISQNDLLVIYYLRKKTFLHLLPSYTQDYQKAIEIIRELEDLTQAQQAIYFTEHAHTTQQLKHNEKLYKSALSLTHIGNWTWDLVTDKITWSDELYNIFSVPQGQDMNFNTFLSFVHPGDKEQLVKALTDSINHSGTYSINYRIKAVGGATKILSANWQTTADKNGSTYKLIGTCQDITEKQTLIELLEKSEHYYKQAEALSHIGNWRWNLQDNTITWSDELYRIYEIPKTDGPLTIEQVQAFVLPEDKQMVQANLEQQIVEDTKHDFYCRIQLASGKIKTIHSKGELAHDENGKPVTMVGTVQDVTEQKEIENKLRENQLFISKITNATPAFISSYSLQSGKFFFISDGLKKLLGHNPEKAMEQGVSFFEKLIHPDDMELIRTKNAEAINAANQTKKLASFDAIIEVQYRIKNAEGKYRWLHNYGTVFSRDKDGNVEQILNISVDVTDKREMGERLREQEKLNRYIAEASPSILYLYDLVERRFLYVNKEVQEVFGYTPEELIALGEKANSFAHPEDMLTAISQAEKIKHAGSQSTMRQFEGRVKDKNNNWKWLLTREIVTKRDKQGNATQVIGSALDITSRKKMEHDLLHKTMQLQQSNTNLEEFAHIASHDLQEPLRKISTFGNRLLMSQKELLTEDGKTYLDKIVKSTQRMQQMINDILSISLISSEKTFEKYSLQLALDEVLQTLEYKIESKNARIIFDNLPVANVVPAQFRQLFQNLLSNSLKFTDENLQPLIHISHQHLTADEAAFYGLTNGETFLKITFTDNGIGFDAKYSEKIFAIFQRLHGRSEYEGTGIGLAICKKIVEHHHGIIFANSEGRGGQTTFTVIIPI